MVVLRVVAVALDDPARLALDLNLPRRVPRTQVTLRPAVHLVLLVYIPAGALERVPQVGILFLL